jgi:hypothetical protein
MGPWNTIVNAIIKVMVDALEEYERLKKDESYKLELNLANILAIYGRISDMVTIA